MTTATKPTKAVYRRPWLTSYQLDAIFCRERYGITEATTKAGKTVGCMAWLTEQALVHGRPGRNYWWVAPIFPQAKIAFRRLKRGIERGNYRANESELTLTLPNDAVIWFKGAEHPDSLYGEDVYAAVVDEASRVKEESWHAVRSTLTHTRGPIRIIGNVKGRKNWAYQLARRAEAGAPDMHYAKITAFDAVQAGILDMDEVEDARRTLPANIFQELYLGEPSDDEGNPFGIQAIRSCIKPLASSAPDSWGIDLAKSVDWTVLLALDASGRTCRFSRYQRPWEETITDISRQVGTADALIDSTGVGDPIVERLQRLGSNFQGLKFTSVSKQQLMEGLATAIQMQEISYPDGPIVAELEAFEYEYTRTGVRYSGPEGMHDDCVMALALAQRKRTAPRFQWGPA